MREVDWIWRRIRFYLPAYLAPGLMKLWIEPLKPMRLEGRTLVMGCPDKFFLENIEDRFLDVLKQAAEDARMRVDLRLALLPPKETRAAHARLF